MSTWGQEGIPGASSGAGLVLWNRGAGAIGMEEVGGPSAEIFLDT